MLIQIQKLAGIGLDTGTHDKTEQMRKVKSHISRVRVRLRECGSAISVIARGLEDADEMSLAISGRPIAAMQILAMKLQVQ